MRIGPGVAAVLTAAVFMFVAGGQAAGSTASLEKVNGKPTLALVAKAGESNNISLTSRQAGRIIELRETGDRANYTDVELLWKPGSLPGCEFTHEFNDPAYGLVTCRAKKVKRIFLQLGNQDDYLTTGDGYRNSTKVRVQVFARGGKGNDQLAGGTGTDYLFGEAGQDIIEGGKGNDRLSGGAGVDAVSGDQQYSAGRPPARGGNDLLIGGAARDYLYPGSGRDRVSGGAGNDIVSSVIDRDRDTVDCGAGRADSLLGVNSRGYRFAEKSVSNCESVSNGLFGSWVWQCRRSKCVASATTFAAREEA